MARLCKITGKKTITGNNVSNSNRKTKRKFYPNLQNHRLWSDTKKKYIKLRITKKALKNIDKYGLDLVLRNTHGIKIK